MHGLVYTRHTDSSLRPFHLPLNLHFIRPSVFRREAALLRFDDLENELCFDSDISRREMWLQSPTIGKQLRFGERSVSDNM